MSRGALRAGAIVLAIVFPSSASMAGEAGDDPVAEIDPKVKAEAEAALFAGVKLMEEGRFPDAVKSFEAVLRLVPTATAALLQIGRAHHKLGNCAAAIPHLERYLELKTARAGAADPEAKTILEYCKVTAAPRVTVTSEPPGAFVRLDSVKGRLLGETPLEPTPIPLGLHSLYIAKSGFAVAAVSVVGKYAEVAKAHALLTAMYPVKIKTDVDGAVVRIDGREVGRTPIVGPIPMTEGEHLVEMERDGLPPVSTTVRVVAGTKEIHVPMPGVVPAPPGTERRRPRKLAPWIALGGAVAAAGGTAIVVAVVLGSRSAPSLGSFGAR